MAKPSRERVRRWREKQAKKGGRSLSTWLEPETAQSMDYLLKHYGETAASLVARAIAALHAATVEAAQSKAEPPGQITSETAYANAEMRKTLIDSTRSSGQEQPKAVEAILDNSTQDVDPILLQMQEKLGRGMSFKQLQKTILVDWIKSMKSQGVSYQNMAERLNAAGIPTLSGKGRWEQGMIPTVLLLSSF